jgi:hypothetical protein
VVERKDKDFNILREYLVKKYPHILVPACPDHFSQTKFEESTCVKKMELLEMFMNKLVKNEELIASPVVLDFLKKEG